MQKLSSIVRLLVVIVVSLAAMACGEGIAPVSSASGLSAADAETMTLYNRSCISCHAGGSGGAPRTGDQVAWKPRLEKGMPVLLENSLSGYRGMPAMGMCKDCSAEQIEALIRFMSQS